MPLTHSAATLVNELARRIEGALNTKIQILQYSNNRWHDHSEDDGDDKAETDDLILQALQESDVASNELTIWSRMDTSVYIANPSLNTVPLSVACVVLPNQNQSIIQSLISTHIEALKLSKLALANRLQIESFIDQVTQDFEELTWLRDANECLDLCDPKHTLVAIATHCLPDLARVIRAESILFVPSKFNTISEIIEPDFERVFSTSVKDSSVAIHFLQEIIPQLGRDPRIANRRNGEESLQGFAGLRNCLAHAVSKDRIVYGWLLCINKLQSTMSADPFAIPSFGTFEAGLLSAAANIMSSQARNCELFDAQEALLTGVIRAIINAIDAKDPYTCGHSDRVANYAMKIAVFLGLSSEECEQIYMAGLLHDVGKIGIPDSILGKPGKLTDDEYAVVKKHPEIGHSILKHLKQLDYVLPGVLHHHEAFNGNGYPSGLKGDAIPLHGRILAVADAYDAMTSDRPYRSGMPSSKAESILTAEAGKTWDPGIVQVFLKCIADQEIEPHEAKSASMMPTSEMDTNSTTNLMWRIANSLNSMAVG